MGRLGWDMKRLCYETLQDTGYEGFLLREAPERILQFGQGNFLRAFVDDFVDEMNEKAGFHGKVVVVQSGRDSRSRFNDQNCLYTLLLRGKEKGEHVSRKRVISSLSRVIHATLDFEEYLACAANPDLRFIVSNTTEAGIVYDPACAFTDQPASSFPGKLTQLLYHRFELGLPGFIILSCELIDHNGQELERCVLSYVKQWGLSDAFAKWLEEENVFCSTLVDRIVPGYPREEEKELWDEFGYEDKIMDAGEPFASWVIEGPSFIAEELPFEKAGLPIRVVDNVDPYKHRKVRILNGAHTSFALAAFMSGEDVVGDCMKEEVFHRYLEKTLYEEVIPTLTDLPRENLENFAKAVLERFANPYIEHHLLSIALNSVAKWKARCLPSLEEYVAKEGRLPSCLTFSFAALLTFYRAGKERGEGCLIGEREKGSFEIQDDPWVLDFFYEHREDPLPAFVKAVVSNEQMWEGALLSLPGFEEAVLSDLTLMAEVGVKEAMGRMARKEG